MAITNFIMTVGMSDDIDSSPNSADRFCHCHRPTLTPANSLLFFVITITVGVGAVVYLMKTDVRQGSSMLRRNLRHIRGWLEEQSATVE